MGWVGREMGGSGRSWGRGNVTGVYGICFFSVLGEV